MHTKVITVRMPSELHKKLIDAAEKRSRSMNLMCLDILAKDVGVEEPQMVEWLKELGYRPQKRPTKKREPGVKQPTPAGNQEASPRPASGDRD